MCFLGAWRKKVTVIADEGDGNTHFNDAQIYADGIIEPHCDFNVTKVYAESYLKVFYFDSTRYPGVEAAIINSFQNGSLIINYTGHGDNDIWAFTHLFVPRFINGFTNFNKLPLCINPAAFNDFDDPAFLASGERLLLRPNGGVIANICPSRGTYTYPAFQITTKLETALFTKVNSEYQRLGDAFRSAKIQAPANNESWCLLGDPALTLNYPKNQVVVNTLNGIPLTTASDTLFAGDSINIAGELHDVSGNLMPSFNGTLHLVIFDRQHTRHTLVNNPGSAIKAFKVWDDTLVNSAIPIINGNFASTFVLPESGVDSAYGKGKISFYADNGTTDASGCYTNFVFANLVFGVHENQMQNLQVSLQPNPSNNKMVIYVKGNQGKELYFTLRDLQGRAIQQHQLMNKIPFEISKADMQAGMYLYSIETKDAKIVKRGRLVFE